MISPYTETNFVISLSASSVILLVKAEAAVFAQKDTSSFEDVDSENNAVSDNFEHWG